MNFIKRNKQTQKVSKSIKSFINEGEEINDKEWGNIQKVVRKHLSKDFKIEGYDWKDGSLHVFAPPKGRGFIGDTWHEDLSKKEDLKKELESIGYTVKGDKEHPTHIAITKTLTENKKKINESELNLKGILPIEKLTKEEKLIGLLEQGWKYQDDIDDVSLEDFDEEEYTEEDIKNLRKLLKNYDYDSFFLFDGDGDSISSISIQIAEAITNYTNNGYTTYYFKDEQDDTSKFFFAKKK